LRQVSADLEGLRTDLRGGPAVHERMKSAFGAIPVEKAVGIIAGKTRDLRESGKLKATPAGVLTTGAGVPVRDRRFFGGPASA
jgi:hypothetical protein